MLSFLVDGGQMGAAMRAYEWAQTPLGPAASWPTPLKTLIGIVLGSNQPMFVAWGEDQTLFYNDAYAEILADKHPNALGQPFLEVWSEIRDDLVPIVAAAYRGDPVHMDDITLMMKRRGYVEETHFAFSYTPIRAEGGIVSGFFCACTEITAQVLSDRRRDLDAERQRRMFEQAPGFITIVHGPEHTFEFANATYRRLFGDRDFAGRTVREVFPELEGQGFYELLDRVFETGERFIADQVPVTLRQANGIGETRYLDFIYEPITDEAGNVTGIFVEGHDATEARRAHAELREIDERNRRIVEAVTDYSIFTVDADGVIVDWTPGAEAIFGWPADEARGKPTDIIFTPEDRGRGVPEQELATARARGCANDERWHLRRDGSRFFANGSVRPLHDEQGAITGFIKIARDETERRAAEAVLRETEQRYRLAAKATNDAIWDWDLLANRVEWNEAIFVLFGFAAEQVQPTGDWWIENIHPDDRSRIDHSIHRVIDGDEDQWMAEYRFRRADGTYADVFDRGAVFRNGAGQAIRMIGAMLDLTERKAAEKVLRESNDLLEARVAERTAELMSAQDALRQAQKMEAVGQLTGGIAHDFNNLLAGIGGSLEVIERRISQGRTDGIDRFLSGAQISTQRAAALTQRLLAFSRRQTLDPKPTEVNRLVLGMEDLIHRTVGPAIKIEVVGAAGLWPTLVDAAQLESALLNLAINARDAMPEGGKLTFETANKWLDERAGGERDLPTGQYISVCVTDTGTGIPKDIAERIFDPFFTTKPIGQGTGLGLSMIHGFVRQSGGQVRVYSEPGQGTTMCLYLPRYIGEVGNDGEVMQETIAEVGDGQVVLVIDDEPIVRMLIVEVAEEAGYTTLEADDGPSGLKILASDVKIDLLITDVGLPGGMNGRQVADAARVTRPDLKVLFVTGYAENAAVSNGHLDPSMSVVTKPFVMAELANKITDMIER